MKPAITGTELLNKVQSTLIAFTMRFLLDSGFSVPDAFNAVMGNQAAYQQIAESVWTKLATN